jgi:O-antigen ligase
LPPVATRMVTSVSSASERYLPWLLIGLGVVLPSFEVPKNLFLVLILLLLLTSGRRVLGRALARPDALERALLAMIAATALSVFWNWAQVGSYKAVKDAATQAMLFWTAYRLPLNDGDRRRIAAAICLGAIVGLAYGTWETLVGRNALLQFHLVGVATRSALYLGIATFVAIGLLLCPARPGWHWRRLFVLSATLVMFVAMWLMGSRGAILALLLAMTIAIVSMRSVRIALATGMVVLTAAAVAFALPNAFQQDRLFNKTHSLFDLALSDSDMVRVSVWKVAVSKIGAGDDLLVGIGPRGFKSVVSASPTAAADPALSAIGHAHNLFLNKLIEEGLLGLSAFVTFLALLGVRLYRALRRTEISWLPLAALGALVVPIVGGSFNSPFIKEHALLAMLVLGLWMGSQPRAAQQG